MKFSEYQESAKGTAQFLDKRRALENSIANLGEKVDIIYEILLREEKLLSEPDSHAPPSIGVDKLSDLLGDVLWFVADIARGLGIDLEQVAEINLKKIKEKWGSKVNVAQYFDCDFDENEQLPRKITFKLEEWDNSSKTQKIVILSTKLIDGSDIQLGERITDNAHQEDGYRYHDILHLGYMAILRWSPVVRRMLKRKRKSNLEIDEVEDGARAANLEEGLTAVIYQYAKDNDYFKGFCTNNKQVPFYLLKTVERLVHGLEVRCYTYEIWNKAILEGYKVFNLAREHRGGFIDVDMETSTVSYRLLEDN